MRGNGHVRGIDNRGAAVRSRIQHAAVATLVGIGTVFVAVPGANAYEPEPFLADGTIDAGFGIDELHEAGLTGEGVTIAIAGEGFAADVPDLRGADVTYMPLPEQCRLDPPADSPGTDYTTGAVTTIAGQGGDDMIAGVAPRAKVLVYQVPPSGADPSGADWPEGCDRVRVDLAARMMQADADGADVFLVGDDVQRDQHLAFQQPGNGALEYWALRDHAYLIPIGDRGGHNAPESATYYGAIGVAAMATPTELWHSSTLAEGLVLAAPGVDIPVRALANGSIESASSSVYAAATVCGVLALLQQAAPEATTHQLTQLIRSTAEPLELDSPRPNQVVEALNAGGLLDVNPQELPDDPAFEHFSDPRVGDPELSGLRSILAGEPPASALHFPHYYRKGAGIPESALEWLPERAVSESWQTTPPANPSLSENEPAQSQTEAGRLLLVVAFFALIVVGGIVFSSSITKRGNDAVKSSHQTECNKE